MHRALRFGWIGLVILAAGSPLRAAGDWTASFETIRAAAANVHSVQAKFEQRKQLKILRRPLVTTGRFAFEAPDSIRWEYAAPLRSLLLMDHGKLQRFAWRDGAWVPDAAERVEAMRVVVEQIQAWLTGRFTDSPIFAARRLPTDPVQVELTPKDPGMAALIQKIVLTLDRHPGQLRSLEIVEGPDATTRIVFGQIELNAPLPPDTFRSPE